MMPTVGSEAKYWCLRWATDGLVVEEIPTPAIRTGDGGKLFGAGTIYKTPFVVGFWKKKGKSFAVSK